MIKEMHLPLSKPNAFALLASCDGLLLFQDRYRPSQLYVCNPLTGDFAHLPHVSCSKYGGWALIPDASGTNVYKVLGINCSVLLETLIFGDKTVLTPDDWKLCSFAKKDYDSTPFRLLSEPLVVGKTVYWLTTGLYQVHNQNQDCFCIYALDFDKGTFVRNKLSPQLAKPRDYNDFSKCRGPHLLSVLKGGSLCLTLVSRCVLKMFVLNRSIWKLSHTVFLQTIFNRPAFLESFWSDNICLVSMRCVDISNLPDLVKVLIHHEDQLALFDLKTQELREIGILSKDQKLDRSYFHHSNSLLSCAWTSN
ncbi:hypothetical protein ACHQM5_001911 [Ranunculus cassubicifolius]